MYDVIVIGAGPAGLSAATYSGRAGLSTLVLESKAIGGKLIFINTIENYPGYLCISGPQLAEFLHNQAEKFNAEIFPNTKVTEIKKHEDHFVVSTKQLEYKALSVIVATGTEPAPLNVKGEREFLGRGVSYCAVCDGPLFKGKDVVVVGGGDSAVSEVLFLSNLAKSVTLIHRRNQLRAAKFLQERIKKIANVKILFSSVVTEIIGKSHVEGVVVKSLCGQGESVVNCAGVFICVGNIPNSFFLHDSIKKDPNGYIITDSDMATSEEGIFACGDVCSKDLRQIVLACSEGTQAAHSAWKYINSKFNLLSF